MLRCLLHLPLHWQLAAYLVGVALFLGLVFGVAPLVWERAKERL